MKIHENLWKSTKVYESQLKLMKIDENQLKSMKASENGMVILAFLAEYHQILAQDCSSGIQYVS